MTRRDVDRALRELAERQHGVVSRAQARRLGADRSALRRRTASGEWDAATPEALRLVGATPTFEQGCMVAVLHAGDGAVVSHQAAARLWGLPGFSEDRVRISKHRDGSRRRSLPAELHEPRYLPAHHRTIREGIPLTTAGRTVFDLAGCLHPLRAERALDNALARRLVALEALRAVAIELLEHGRAGSALMRQLLIDRGAGYIPPASGLEARFFALMVDAGLALPERQVDVGGGSWVGRVDYLYRHLGLVIEVDSDLHHTSKLDAEADARRDQSLRAAGFEVLRVTGEQVWERPYEVVSLVRCALRRAA